MEHKGTKRIETPGLILRRFEAGDEGAMFHNWASDPEVTKFLSWPTHGSLEVSKWVVDDWISHYSEDNYYQWAIVPKGLGQPIGSMAGVRQEDAIGAVEIGYCIGKKWWHQGYTSEALAAVIGFFFDEVGMNRLEARHDANNPNSGAVMRKCGMRFEGLQRKAGRNNQGICDICVYGILREDLEKNATK